MNVEQKVAIITGASAGIGRATAKLLSSLGARVVLASRSEEALFQLSHELPDSLAICTDMTKEEEINSLVQKTVSHFGTVDILINNAGQGYDAPIKEIDINTFRYLFELNVVAPLITMQQVIPIMQSEPEGSIINISSGTALMYLPGMGAYSSLKRAVGGLSLTAREELKDSAINVSIVYPYVTLTDFEKNTIKSVDAADEPFDFSQLPFPPDPAELVAQKILEAIQTSEAEVFVHDWMKKS